jgi:5,10-methenyltetrahydromethanopterin hydrogenase
MVTLTLYTNKDRTISYSAELPHLQTIGEFLVKDSVQMPDFIRAFLSCEDEEFIVLDACSIQTKKDSFIIKHLYQKTLPMVHLPKTRMLQIFEIWEDFLMQKNATQWIFFKEEEFGLASAHDEKITPIIHQKEPQKEKE